MNYLMAAVLFLFGLVASAQNSEESNYELEILDSATFFSAKVGFMLQEGRLVNFREGSFDQTKPYCTTFSRGMAGPKVTGSIRTWQDSVYGRKVSKFEFKAEDNYNVLSLYCSSEDKNFSFLDVNLVLGEVAKIQQLP